MIVRGAPLIGATYARGMALAMRDDASDAALDRAHDVLAQTRPTAINLRWALKRMCDALRNHPRQARAALAWAEAAKIADEDVEVCRAIGEHGLEDHSRYGDEEKSAGRGAQHPHPLQCGLARLRRLGHGAGADLHGA